MELIYNGNVQESKVYQAYGLTVYGKINRYEGIAYNGNALITIRILDANGNDIFLMYLGNNFILQHCTDDTLDNFLWWIVEDCPDSYAIE